MADADARRPRSAASNRSGSQHAAALDQRTAQIGGGQLVEDHRRQDEVEMFGGERERVAEVERAIFGARQPEMALRDAQQRPRVVGDDEVSRRLPREAAQRQRQEVTVAGAKLEDCPLCDRTHPLDENVVEGEALERAAMPAGHTVPLLGDAVVVGEAGYVSIPLEKSSGRGCCVPILQQRRRARQ